MIDADRTHAASTTTGINLHRRPKVPRRLSSATLPDNTRTVNFVSANPIPESNVTRNPIRPRKNGKLIPRALSLFLRKKSTVASLTEAESQLARMASSSKAHDIPGCRTPNITFVDFMTPVEREQKLKIVIESTVTESVDDGFDRTVEGVAKQPFQDIAVVNLQDNVDTCSSPVSPLSPSFDSIFPVRVKKRNPVEVVQLHRLKSMQRLGMEAYKDVMEKYPMSAEERALAYRCF
ncbi:uncharacterized protein LACBIDRAFT_331303 [Laccaria bicolor S238N-H82]|uniref:Predicted protein n=1 Tax=Laccaria bicolor (strain S238N-H82 / ATCC MYA-4686) TaxID=486041 RepID=B0DP28_LACBS|nr:uncharacterized protein LACBIDRAFT_331303 [Laccaria bicolor S238N-H82]EDR03614.1 predicted protein [Laccaria bicolor S238N-H82]|eukprot:XP_001885762.1 predicted protein [Laccaria bicolor S238N-H82]